MDTAAFAELARHLPRVAEEGPDRERISEATLIDRVSEAAGGRAQAEGLVASVRRQFVALALLDDDIVARGEWQFVSFPAALYGRGLVTGFADGGFKILDKGFWEAAEFRVDRQRELLRGLELQRVASSPRSAPIRRVWVAWALIASDGKFLMVSREDRSAERTGSRGRFVFPGGKASAADLTGLTTDLRLALFDPNTPAKADEALTFLTKTLSRELDEELELDSHSLSSAAEIGPPIRFVALEGGGSSHALTEYFIQPFRIALTDSGKETVLRVLAGHPERFTWFSREELIAGQNAHNETAFVDAITQLDQRKLEDLLDVDRSNLSISSDTSVAEAIDIPKTRIEPFLFGATGREKQILTQLDESDLADVAFLAAFRRGDPVQELAEHVTAVPSLGWLIIDDDRLLQRARTLATKLRKELPGISILSMFGKAIRLNVAASNLFFSGSWMSLTAEDLQRGKSYRLRIERHQIKSTFGTAKSVILQERVAETLGRGIYELSNRELEFADDNLDTIKRMQRTDLKALLSGVGLRLLVRQVEGVPELAVKVGAD